MDGVWRNDLHIRYKMLWINATHYKSSFFFALFKRKAHHTSLKNCRQVYQYHQRGFAALRETSSSSPAASPKQKEVCAVQQTARRRKCSGQLFTQSDLLPDDKYSLPLALIKNMENRMCQHKKWLNWLPSQYLWLPESTWSLRRMAVTWPASAQQIFPFSSYYHPSFTTLSFKAVKPESRAAP